MSHKTYLILVVDDNQDSAETMAAFLTLSGFEAVTQYDGPSALRACEGRRPDACLIDINMPMMNGYELARQLRERYDDRPPVLATMTAQGDDGHLGRAVEAGFDLQFTKPADPLDVADQLTDAIRAGEAVAPHLEPALLG